MAIESRPVTASRSLHLVIAPPPIRAWHFYSNFVDVLSPVADWQARFDVTMAKSFQTPTTRQSGSGMRFGSGV